MDFHLNKVYDQTHFISNVKIEVIYFSHFFLNRLPALKSFIHITSDKSQKFSVVKELQDNLSFGHFN